LRDFARSIASRARFTTNDKNAHDGRERRWVDELDEATRERALAAMAALA